MSILASDHKRFPYKRNPSLEWFFSSIPDVKKVCIIQDGNMGGIYFRVISYTSTESYFETFNGQIDTEKFKHEFTIQLDDVAFECNPSKSGYSWWFLKIEI